MSVSGEERYAFLVEWYDAPAALIRRYQLLYFPRDSTVEMIDVKNRRPFLKRTKVEEIKVSDLYIGSTVNVLSRQLNFVDYGDEYTRQKLSSRTEKTLAVIKPGAVSKMGAILDTIADSGLVAVNLKMCQLNRNEALAFYREHEGQSFLQDLVNSIGAGPVVAIELMGSNAISVWREVIGPTDPSEARRSAPQSLRARFGKDMIGNAVHGSDDSRAAGTELEFFFPADGGSRTGTARREGTTCAVIKPHAVIAGLAGKIISSILETGFQVTAMGMFHLDRANAEEFLEVYRGVVHEFNGMVVEMTSGPCIAMEISAGVNPTDVHSAFREFCGPHDPEIARHLRPRTLRALYGRDKVHNALHSTDLPEDAPLEVQYFFQILDK